MLKPVKARAVCAAILAAALWGASVGTAGAASDTVRPSPYPVGLWEIRYRDAVGQRYLDLLDFTSAGAYTRFASGGTDDRGRYSVEGGAINFLSDVDPRLSSAVLFERPNDDTLTFILYVPTRLEIKWTRSDRKPFFPTVEIDGHRIPSVLPDLRSENLTVVKHGGVER